MWKAPNAERAAWRAEKVNEVRVELRFVFVECRSCTVLQMLHWWERLQAAKRRAEGIGEPHQSYDSMMAAGMAWVRKRKSAEVLSQQQPQKDPLLPGVVFEEAERAGGGVGLPYLSYDDIMGMGMAGDDAGVAWVGAELLLPQQLGDARAEKLQPQLQRAKALQQLLEKEGEELGDHLGVGSKHVQQQQPQQQEQEPSSKIMTASSDTRTPAACVVGTAAAEAGGNGVGVAAAGGLHSACGTHVPVRPREKG